MPFVYILEMSNSKYYIGSTTNLIDRLKRHFGGREKYTRKYLPLKLVYFIETKTKSEAVKLEYKLKAEKSHKYINYIINNNR